MYSCRFDQELTSKLHIVDPFDLVVKIKSFTKLFDERRMRSTNSDVQVELDRGIYCRFSYHDFLLFSGIFRAVTSSSQVANSPSFATTRLNPAEKMCFLLNMGFSVDQCQTALSGYSAALEQAAYYLCEEQSRSWEQQSISIASLASSYAKGEINHHVAFARDQNEA